jgi:hypothetical protein
MCTQFDHLTLTYEELIRGERHAAIQDFLAVERAALQPGTMRSRIVPRQQCITNFDECVAALAGTPWRAFLDEEEVVGEYCLPV